MRFPTNKRYGYAVQEVLPLMRLRFVGRVLGYPVYVYEGHAGPSIFGGLSGIGQLIGPAFGDLRHSVAARADLWVVQPNEEQDVREYRRKRWAARDYHWPVSFKR